MSRPELETCAVVGVGLVGGSLGMALRASGRTVLGLDLAETLLAQAVACGAIDRGTLDPAELASADLVVVAVPPMRVAETVRAIAPHLKSRAVVVDVASVKGSVVTDVEAAAHAGIHFVGSHPMFGSEGHGVGSARAELVRGAAWIFTPTASTDPGALAALERLARELDMRPVRLEPAEHDRQLGALSHLPYLISVALTRTAPGFQVAGP
ncbi:MAG TPA: prephenate dehydrogenase/arogenate dehydrogenase family protein, partial [Myxococcaceae bacterium]|nr:prephenate dehydrogenase/arogenate dehydrogenase family protein [Myxococcaceae bacterium]